jgi:two-component system response regulator PilR (NtrC family)
MEKILVVDDEKSMRDFLSIVLKKEGYYVSTAGNGDEALKLLQTDIYDLVLTDIKMPGADGLEILRTAKRTSPDTVVLMITAYASAETAIEAMKQGAYDYISKPFQIEEVKLIIHNALEQRRLKAEVLLLRRELKGRGGLQNLIGQGPAMQKVFDVVRKVADTKSNILILGESGTGKELVARAIHSLSSRRDKPFVTVNCGALPEPLLESELFGHMKGSFTGAYTNKAGLFEVANGGVIFLDEIGDTPSSIQVKLLRVLEDQEFRRVGGIQSIKVDVRIIAATNKDLERAVADGSFREDLYYRLDVIPILLPPLRERTEDIPLLARYFLDRFGQTSGKMVRQITPEAMRLLQSHDWKGNVRELENVMERVVALASGEVLDEQDFRDCLQKPALVKSPLTTELPGDGLDLDGVIGEYEKTMLRKALDRTGGSRREAARLLRLNMRSLRYRLQKYQIGSVSKDPTDTDADEPDSSLEDTLPSIH